MPRSTPSQSPALNFRRLWNVARPRPTSTCPGQGTDRRSPLHGKPSAASLMLAHYDGDGDAAFNGPDADRCAVAHEAGLSGRRRSWSGILAKAFCAALGLAVDLEERRPPWQWSARRLARSDRTLPRSVV